MHELTTMQTKHLFFSYLFHIYLLQSCSKKTITVIQLMFVGIKYVFDPWVMNCMGLYFYIQCEDKHENVEERQSLLYEGAGYY